VIVYNFYYEEAKNLYRSVFKLFDGYKWDRSVTILPSFN